MINVSKLKSGIVIDHIVAGHGYKLFKQLHLDEIDDVVVLMRNVESEKKGKKDLIKIETTVNLDLDVIGLIDPGITINYIENGVRVNKVKLKLPESVTGILTCKNPRCISNIEKVGDVTFHLVDPDKKEYACEFCDSRTHL